MWLKIYFLKSIYVCIILKPTYTYVRTYINKQNDISIFSYYKFVYNKKTAYSFNMLPTLNMLPMYK